VVWVHYCMLTVHYLPGNAELLFMGMNRMGTEKQINQYIQCAIWLCKVCLFEIILSSVTFEMYTCLYYSIFIRCISFFDQLSWFFLFRYFMPFRHEFISYSCYVMVQNARCEAQKQFSICCYQRRPCQLRPFITGLLSSNSSLWVIVRHS